MTTKLEKSSIERHSLLRGKKGESMRLRFFLFLLLFNVILSAMDTDSLEVNLQGIENGERLPVLLALMGEYSYQEPSRAIEYSVEALELAEVTNDRHSEAKISTYLGDSYYYLGDILTSLNWYEKAAELVKKLEGEESPAYENRLGDVGYCQELLMQFDASIETYKKALKIARKSGDWQEIIIILNNIGNSYYKMAQYEKALDYLQQTLKAEEEHGEESNLSVVLNSIGMVYQAWGDKDKAIIYYNRALEIDRKYSNMNKIGIRLNNLGLLYEELNKYDTALGYLKEAMEADKHLNDEYRLAIRLSNIASIYIMQGEFDSTLVYLREVEKYLEKNDDVNLKATYYRNYGGYYFQRGLFDEAVKYHKKSLDIAEEYDLDQLRHSGYKNISVAFEKTGDYQSAYKYLNDYTALHDSLFTEEKLKQIAELELKYETAKKEKEIELLKKNAEFQNLQLSSNRRMRNLLFLILFLILLLVAVLLISYRRKMDVKRVLQEKRAMEQSRLAILGELSAGIVHEINQPLQSMSFTLENVKIALEEGYAEKEYLDKKTGYLSEDVSRMQRIINHIRTFSHHKSEEKQEPFNINDSVRNALNMTQERYIKHGIRIDLSLSEHLPLLMGNMYSFEQVILILLSNARDAVEERSLTAGNEFQKKIYLGTQLRGGQIIVQIGDNGKGIPDEIVDKVFKPFFTTKETGKGTGLGLSIANGIINEMGGEIMINTVTGKGTIIKLSFNVSGE